MRTEREVNPAPFPFHIGPNIHGEFSKGGVPPFEAGVRGRQPPLPGPLRAIPQIAICCPISTTRFEGRQ